MKLGLYRRIGGECFTCILFCPAGRTKKAKKVSPPVPAPLPANWQTDAQAWKQLLQTPDKLMDLEREQVMQAFVYHGMYTQAYTVEDYIVG